MVDRRPDPELVERIKSCKLDPEKWGLQPEVLIQLDNLDSDVALEVNHLTEEFTSVCPFSPSQPDHATLEIACVPGAFLVELKSLKIYLTSYRNFPISHEAVPALILKDLLPILGDIPIRITGWFTVRGGIKTTVVARNIPQPCSTGSLSHE